MSRRSPGEFLPLKALELQILTVLAVADRHGYGIRQDIAQLTGQEPTVEAGNLYRHIYHLEEDGLLEASRRVANDGDERRQNFRLTPLGRRVLVAELLRLRAIVQQAESLRLITPLRA